MGTDKVEKVIQSLNFYEYVLGREEITTTLGEEKRKKIWKKREKGAQKMAKMEKVENGNV